MSHFKFFNKLANINEVYTYISYLFSTPSDIKPRHGLHKKNCKIITLGGELEVVFDRVLEQNFYNIWLKGPAEFIYEGKIDLTD